MVDANWNRAQKLFHAALSREPDDRESFLSAACVDDDALHDEVRSLLESDSQADALFPLDNVDDHCAVEAPEVDPLIGTRFDQYTIKSVIATGGMSTVYLAEQDRPRRSVALKVMSAAYTSREALKRFEFESQVLARLQHPNIAQVYDAGTARPEMQHASHATLPPTDVPYFVMEYVPDAQSITDHARERYLPTRRRLELFVKVCDAVHYGHQRGIIHRDLKPANILVDANDQPKVIDFGVARATNSDVAVTTMRTDVGQLIGTLQYMSPEQCDADPHNIDTRSDVYSLGVVLYELLCDRLPYDVRNATIHAATRTICGQPPDRPSARDRKLRGDIEQVMLKALEKDRDKRYASAAEFAADLRRFLRGEPVEAKPPTAWVKAIRWTIRHPVVATTCACLLAGVSIIGASAASVWFLYERPYKIAVPDSRRSTALLSRTGNVLHEWQSATGSVQASLLDDADYCGNGMLAAVGFAQAKDNPFPNSLCVYDASDIDAARPLWERHIKQTDLPQRLLDRGFRAEEFGVDWLWTLDIFPDPPGKELVVCHSHTPFSETAIRIYDLSGNVLYQVWYDGVFGHAYWMQDARLLVFRGQNSEAYWEDRGVAGMREAHPHVIIAIEPQRGLVSREYLRDDGRDDPLSLRWQLALYPYQVSNRIGFRGILAPLGAYDSGRHVMLEITANDQAAGFSWTLNREGRIVPDSLVVSDQWQRSANPLPDPRSLTLVPLPPIVSKTGEIGAGD